MRIVYTINPFVEIPRDTGIKGTVNMYLRCLVRGSYLLAGLIFCPT